MPALGMICSHTFHVVLAMFAILCVEEPGHNRRGLGFALTAELQSQIKRVDRGLQQHALLPIVGAVPCGGRDLSDSTAGHMLRVAAFFRSQPVRFPQPLTDMSRSISQWTTEVGFPYDTSLMFFWEFYSMNMPTFAPLSEVCKSTVLFSFWSFLSSHFVLAACKVPFQLWHWGVFGRDL